MHTGLSAERRAIVPASSDAGNLLTLARYADARARVGGDAGLWSVGSHPPTPWHDFRALLERSGPASGDHLHARPGVRDDAAAATLGDEKVPGVVPWRQPRKGDSERAGRPRPG